MDDGELSGLQRRLAVYNEMMDEPFSDYKQSWPVLECGICGRRWLDWNQASRETMTCTFTDCTVRKAMSYSFRIAADAE